MMKHSARFPALASLFVLALTINGFAAPPQKDASEAETLRTQTQAATMMGLRQPDVPKLLRGRFEGFSLERLLFFVRSLGSDIEIKIRPTRPKQEGRILVTT